MRIEALVVEAFGPFVDRTFEFAPGFNLVHGPNEAGKSSLHAALYAALGGVRRGRGKSGDEESFDRYRPWDRQDPWRVRIRLQLADGRRVEVVQDLGNKPKSRAFDADFGRDLTSEILPTEGTPDATKWLGLDRRAFLATACVRQAQLVDIRKNPEALQEHLQRAAATSGTDATAAEALARLESFRREHVGAKQSNSTKPLRRAMDALEEARETHDRGLEQHAAYLDLLSREETLVEARDVAAQQWVLGRAARACREAALAAQNLERARELVRRFPEGAPPGLVADDDLAREVERALADLAARPIPVALEGTPLDALREEMQKIEQAMVKLPGARVAVGTAGSAIASAGAAADTARQSMAAATARLRDATERVRAARVLVHEHAARRPPQPRGLASGGAKPEELRMLAGALERPEPHADPALEALERDLAGSAVRAVRRAVAFRRAGFVAVFGALVLGAVAILAGLEPARVPAVLLDAGFVAAGLAAGAVGCFLVARASRPAAAAQANRREVESRRLEWRLRRDDWMAERDTARATVRSRGLPEDPAALRELADAWVLDEQARARHVVWEETDTDLRTELEARESALRRLLDEQGAPAGPDVLQDADSHEQQRMLQVQHDELEQRLARRERAEQAHAEAWRERRAAEERIGQVAHRCGVVAEDLQSRCAGLESWRAARRAALARQESSLREWAELEQLLAGRTHEALASATDVLERRARELAAGLDPQAVAADRADDAELERREKAVRIADSALEKLRVEIQLRAQSMPRVSELEESLREAEDELECVQRLETTLEKTRDLLQRAQDRVHRDVAPMLAASVREWLPAVTAGRYDDVRIDPAKLNVQVRERDGEWRAAEVLSHGTAEQVYMLLRLAMARHLVRRGEVSPLLLDDVTVQFDRDRKRAMLETLHRTSAERQVILLTQEEDVLEWARSNLVAPADTVIVLDAPH